MHQFLLAKPNTHTTEYVGQVTEEVHESQHISDTDEQLCNSAEQAESDKEDRQYYDVEEDQHNLDDEVDQTNLIPCFLLLLKLLGIAFVFVPGKAVTLDTQDDLDDNLILIG